MDKIFRKKLKKCLVVFGVVAMAVIWSVMAGGNSVSASEKSNLKQRVESYSGEKVRKIFYKDFDKDGKLEAVAITSQKKMEGGIQYGSVWFVDSRSCKFMFRGDDGYIYEYSIKLQKVKNGYFFMFEKGYGGSGSNSYAFFIKGRSVIKISNTFMNLKYIRNNKFVQEHSTFDGIYDSMSDTFVLHTWKKYWFYWNGKELKEYGGIKVSTKQLKKKKGGKKVLNKIKKEKGKVIGIYYRKNKIVNINYKTGGRNYHTFNITMTLSKGKLKYYKANTYGKNAYERAKECGTYLSNISSNAVYPKKFK